MRTLSAGLTGHLATRTHTRAKMLRLDLQDGTTLAICDHSAPLSFDLGDGSATYYPQTGIIPSDLSLSIGFQDSDEVEVSGPVVDTVTQPWHITRTAVIGGRFDEAVARLFEVNWADLTQGAIPLMKGYVTKSQVIGGRFQLSIQSEMSRFRKAVGRVITGYCDADFGDTRCGVTPDTLSATVDTVTDERTFTVSFIGAYASRYFERGTVTFTSGDLNGTRPVEIATWSDLGAVTLFMPLAEVPQVGDTLTLTQGCFDPATNSSKTRTACMSFSNIVNFRGFPDVPGTDQVLRYPNR